MTTRELRAICQKGDAEPFLVSRYFYRHFTIHFTRLYIAWGLSANAATFHSLLVGLAAAAFALSPDPRWMLAVAICVQVYWILDHVDGELARYGVRISKKPRTLDGEFFDMWTHLHTINLLFAALGLGIYRQTGQLLWPILGLLACNIAGSYQRLSLAAVLVGAFGGRIRPGDPRFAPLIGAAGEEAEAATTGRKLSLRRVAPLIAQLVLFPGNLANVTLACLGDFALAALGQPSWYCRAAFLLLYCVVGLASKIYRTRATIRHLRSLPLDPP